MKKLESKKDIKQLTSFMMSLLLMFFCIFYVTYGFLYLLNFFRLFFSYKNHRSYSEEHIIQIIKYGVESPNVITISIGIVFFLFIYNLGFSAWLKSRKKILFGKNRLIYRLVLYFIMILVLSSIISFLGLSISKYINVNFGLALDSFYFWFYWAAMIPGVHALLKLFEVKKKTIKVLLYLIFILAFGLSFLYYRYDVALQLLFQHIGNSLVLISFGVHIYAEYFMKNKQIVE